MTKLIFILTPATQTKYFTHDDCWKLLCFEYEKLVLFPFSYLNVDFPPKVIFLPL